jgi:hypothetical protein
VRYTKLAENAKAVKRNHQVLLYGFIGVVSRLFNCYTSK